MPLEEAINSFEELKIPAPDESPAIMMGSNGKVRVITVNGVAGYLSKAVLKEKGNYPGISLELEETAEVLTASGIEVFFLTDARNKKADNDFYPGDVWVYINGRYVPSSHFGGLGESGFVVPGKGFVLVGEGALSTGSYIEAGLTPRRTSFWITGKDEEREVKFGDHQRETDRKSFRELARKVYGVEEVYLMPGFTSEASGLRDRSYTWGHIDLFIGSVPEKNVLSVAKFYYEKYRRSFDEIAERFRPDLILTSGKFSDFENNYRVFHANGSSFVLMDKRAERLKAELEERGVTVVTTKSGFGNLCAEDSAVHCVTNVLHGRDVFNLLNKQAYRNELRLIPYTQKATQRLS